LPWRQDDVLQRPSEIVGDLAIVERVPEVEVAMVWRQPRPQPFQIMWTAPRVSATLDVTTKAALVLLVTFIFRRMLWT
jgi:hypothetical protein